MTRIVENKQWRCTNCLQISLQPELLTGPSPFDPEDILTGCPKCKSVDGFDEICDEPGCKQRAHCGWPTDSDNDEFGGYRRTCSQHYTHMSPP
jgi:hypothetical protein